MNIMLHDPPDQNTSATPANAPDSGEECVEVFEMPSCGGCSTCELACSFHHTGEFSPANSSLKIQNKPGEEGYRVLIVDKSDGTRIACDACKDLDIPLCVEYCRESDDLGNILNELEKRRARVGKTPPSN